MRKVTFVAIPDYEMYDDYENLLDPDCADECEGSDDPLSGIVLPGSPESDGCLDVRYYQSQSSASVL